MGIAIALLGKNNPLGVLAAAILFGALQAGSTRLDMLTDIPREITKIMQGMIVLLIISEYLFKKYFQKIRVVLKNDS